MYTEQDLNNLRAQLKGDFYTDDTLRTLYATDASAYREMPLAVAIPHNEADIKPLISFANEHKVPLIPRTAGTSLAGQVVGAGIIVDVSKHFTQILEVNENEKWVRVQPGVIRDELNMHLKPFGLYFGPETSTANRAMVGGMIGNNSCGSNSLVYGSTRDHLISTKGYLSDGSEVEFKSLSNEEFHSKREQNNLEGQLYKHAYDVLSQADNREEIEKNFPKKSIQRRNTGYAIDLLKDLAPFTDSQEPFNFCKLIAGSEGTLAFLTEAKLALQPLPKVHQGLLCIHFESVYDSLKGNLVALKYAPTACELMDNYILECTKENIHYRQNRFFVQGDPQAILVVELREDSQEEMERKAFELTEELKAEGLGYHFPLVTGEDTKKVWDLRKAGLGLLSNLPGDAKPAPVIEDTAVDVNDLPEYINDFNAVLKKHNLFCVHYAHAGTGELHLRPILNLKTQEGNELFRTILDEIAKLVKKYNGSLSGEHGDGRLRGEFIPYMIGDKNYQLLKELKAVWDPHAIFNPGKIVDTPAMNTMLRYTPGQETRQFKTALNFDQFQGYLRAAEQCNGSGDCRKTHLSGGTMCPSYMATKNEKDTTRARANILREVLTNSTKENPFDSEEIKDVMDLCLSCKGCKSECPSNVDVGKLKTEFLHQYYKSNGVPLRTKLISSFTTLNKVASLVPGLYNFTFTNAVTSKLAKSLTGFANERSMPLLHKYTLKHWFKKKFNPSKDNVKGTVYLFMDEFTNYNDVELGIKSVLLLDKLGYKVQTVDHEESGRTFLSKGMLDQAANVAQKNFKIFENIISKNTPLIGIEPSAILSFRDEYPDLVKANDRAKAMELASNVLLIDEFLEREVKEGHITASQFTSEKRLIKLHGHCHQKALSSLVPTKKVLSLPANYEVQLIPSGCCGMAGSFGYEKEHYEVSMKIGELVLFPTVRKQADDVIIAANGTSCRHQIKDGTSRKALHLVEIMYDALI
ncbi:FAD-binding and (Fe-S)-binding domain-containing protein [Fulvivirga ligni]|uniref:FAD-binding and (Fe-S)-binding domain-containing protein n=1 Tax=Fulvivirga ligni TaxID=2904246 RepID=UPI001F1CF149|nr:FAD-binding and (Fe-S)-binding domain-containing protein [Fulvivirga ligni]UII23291.1 FAD-binding protein [Fulvivirga ligni]